jgi:hypothetical protein
MARSTVAALDLVHRDIRISKVLDRELARVAAENQMSPAELISTILACNLGVIEDCTHEAAKVLISSFPAMRDLRSRRKRFEADQVTKTKPK